MGEFFYQGIQNSFFHRGKDFLPSAVSTVIEERRNSEVGRQKQSSDCSSMDTTISPPLRVATPASVDKLLEATAKTRSITIKKGLKPPTLAIKRVETKLSQALEKKEKTQKLLAALEKSVEPPIAESDREAISEEERYMLWKVGLRMKPFLFLGRRGVFAGTVENMHRHWKYRELVKIICKDRSMELVESATRTIEAESGGILVAVERVNKGHAIIMYRGKNYRRPADLSPKTLSSKKEAMKRSLEAQRCASLKLHVLSLSRNIDRLRHQMAKKSSAVDTMQLTESDKSDVEGEKNETSWSIGRDSGSAESSYQQENTEEVNEDAAEYLHSNMHDCVPNDEEASTIMPNNLVGLDPQVHHNFLGGFGSGSACGSCRIQPKSDSLTRLFILEDSADFLNGLAATGQLDSSQTDFISNEPEFLQESCQQEQVSESANNSSSKKNLMKRKQSYHFGKSRANRTF